MKNFFDNSIGILFAVLFALVLGVFVFVFVRSLTSRPKNSRAPRLTVMVEVVAKRREIARAQHGDTEEGVGASDDGFLPSTWYYVTFEAESGDRAELQVTGGDYEEITEGSCGVLTFQGNRFLNFEPQKRERL